MSTVVNGLGNTGGYVVDGFSAVTEVAPVTPTDPADFTNNVVNRRDISGFKVVYGLQNILRAIFRVRIP